MDRRSALLLGGALTAGSFALVGSYFSSKRITYQDLVVAFNDFEEKRAELRADPYLQPEKLATITAEEREALFQKIDEVKMAAYLWENYSAQSLGELRVGTLALEDYNQNQKDWRKTARPQGAALDILRSESPEDTEPVIGTLGVLDGFQKKLDEQFGVPSTDTDIIGYNMVAVRYVQTLTNIQYLLQPEAFE